LKMIDTTFVSSSRTLIGGSVTGRPLLAKFSDHLVEGIDVRRISVIARGEIAHRGLETGYRPLFREMTRVTGLCHLFSIRLQLH